MKSFTDRKGKKLNYIIHNPNTVEETTKVLLEICIQANAGKVERKLREWARCNERVSKNEEKTEYIESNGEVFP